MGRSRNDASIKALTAWVLLGAHLASMLVVPAAADERDPLLAVIPPNVVLILDISGSMADDLPANRYVPTKRYPVERRCHSAPRKGKTSTAQPCSSSAIFSGPKYVRAADSVSGVSGSGSEAARSALAESGHWSGVIQGAHITLYTGNYLNYVAAPCASGGACFASKLTVAKRVISSILDTVRGVRFGLMTFHYGTQGMRGARVIAPVGSTVTAAQSALGALAPARDAPLGDALHDAGQYFKGEPLSNGTSFASPIELGCQSNHVVLITDGVQTAGARALTAEAALRHEQDHAPSLPDVQRVLVHTIGFGVGINTVPENADRALSELKLAAESGGGTFAHAATATALEAALRRALAQVTEATYSFTNPVLSVGTTASPRAYLASFRPTVSAPFGRGSLRAYQRDESGLIPVDPNGLPLASALVWDAGHALNRISATSRRIYTEIGGRLTPFARANTAITRTMLGVTTAAGRDRLIDFVRGVDVNDKNRTSGTEERPWKLGAIVHSTPVVVSAPLLALADPSYTAFKAAQAKRTKVVIAGANDGMLHAFRERDGVEIWAFVPPDMLDRLRTLSAADGSAFAFVDGSPVAADIKVGQVWKTVIVFGYRRGGRTYYALDITDTNDPKFLWRFTDSKLQQTWSQPAIGKLSVGGVDRHIAFVGGGHSGSSDRASGNSLLGVDLLTGGKLWEYTGAPNATDDRQYMTFDVVANPTAIDADNDGYVDRIYVGDAGGQLWKFDVSASDFGRWKGKRLFAAEAAGGIDAPPAAVLDRRRNVWLFFGTGNADDSKPTSAGRIYGLKDDTDMTNGAALTPASSGIKDVTSITVAPSQGWYVALGPGERPVAAPNVFNQTALFSTFTPDRVGGCGARSGRTKLYALQAWSGYARMDFATGAPLTSPTAASARSIEIGRGLGSMPVVVLTPPVKPGAPATAAVIIATSTQIIRSTAIPAPAFLKQVTSWRDR